jgi:hypothetical protein
MWLPLPLGGLMDYLNELDEEWNHEINARDHSLRQIGAIVLDLFDALEQQDIEIGSGRADRSTPLGTLLHDTVANVQNFHARTKVIDELREKRREARAARR